MVTGITNNKIAADRRDGSVDDVKPFGIHHVSINVSDLAEAHEFYVGVLGLEARVDRPTFELDGAWLNAGGQQVHLVVAEPPPFLGQHFAVLVDDVASTVDDLRARGVTVSTPSVVGTGLQCFLRDPFGNLIDLHEVGAATRQSVS